jgi:trk system potassium uptake protein TrkH
VREAIHLRQRYFAILFYTGMILVICAVLMLTPLFALIAWPDESSKAWAFILPAVVMGGLGIAALRRLRPTTDVVLSVQEGGVIVLLSWILVCLFSACTFMAAMGMSFTHAMFESVSGWTTTGLSVIDVTQASHVILIWRSTMQLAGGAGFAIIMLSAIAGPTGPALSMAEGREQLVPNVRQSAKLVMTIYSGYVAVAIIALHLAGVDWFDAVNHAFAAISTGGFSTRVDSIGHWNSVAVEAVTIPLMILGNLSFVTAWLLMRGKFRAAGRSGEVRLVAVMVPVCALLLFLLTARGLYPTLGQSARVAIFEAVTALTTTGFSTVGYDNWNAFGWMVLLVLMLIGGGTCSTGGGMKQYRIFMLWKALVWELRRRLLPRTAVTENSVWEADREIFVNDARVREVGTFVFLYVLTFVVGSAILAAHGYGLKESLFEYASTVGTVGLSVGVTSPSAPSGVLWTQIVGMLLGRLEFFVIFVSAAKIVRDTGFMLRKSGRR